MSSGGSIGAFGGSLELDVLLLFVDMFGDIAFQKNRVLGFTRLGAALIALRQCAHSGRQHKGVHRDKELAVYGRQGLMDADALARQEGGCELTAIGPFNKTDYAII